MVILALLGVLLVLVLVALVGRKIEPFELNKEVAPGVKPFIPSEEMGIFGTSRVRVDEILAQGGCEVTLDDVGYDPRVEEIVRQGEGLVQDGQGEQAVNLLQTALVGDPENPDLLLALGDAFRRLDMHNESLEAYNRADASMPGDVSILLRLGDTLQLLGEPELALTKYREVLEINPEEAEAADAVERLEAKLVSQ